MRNFQIDGKRLIQKRDRLYKRLNKNRFLDFNSPKPTQRRLLFTMFTMMLCFGISAYVGCSEYPHVPIKTESKIEYINPYEPPDWSYKSGDGTISALENVLIVLGGFFGFLRLIDFLMLLVKLEDKKD